MIFRTSTILAIAALSLVITAKTNETVAAPAGAPAFAGNEMIQDVRWVCGPVRCVWKPNAVGKVHPWAVTWGPPVRSSCFYEKRRGRWVYVC